MTGLQNGADLDAFFGYFADWYVVQSTQGKLEATGKMTAMYVLMSEVQRFEVQKTLTHLTSREQRVWS